MGFLGLGKGIVKTIVGVATGDADEIGKGLKKVAINLVTTVCSVVKGDTDETISSDDDNDE